MGEGVQFVRHLPQMPCYVFDFIVSYDGIQEQVGHALIPLCHLVIVEVCRQGLIEIGPVRVVALRWGGSLEGGRDELVEFWLSRRRRSSTCCWRACNRCSYC